MAPAVIQIGNKKQSGNGLMYAFGALGTAFAVDYWLSNKKMEEELASEEESRMSAEKAAEALKNLKSKEEPPAPLDEPAVEEISRFSSVDDFDEGELEKFMPTNEFSTQGQRFEAIKEEPTLEASSVEQTIEKPHVEVSKSGPTGWELEKSLEKTAVVPEPEAPENTKIVQEPVDDFVDIETLEKEVLELEQELLNEDTDETIEPLSRKSSGIPEVDVNSFFREFHVAIWKVIFIVALALFWQYGRPARPIVITGNQEQSQEKTEAGPEPIPMLGPISSDSAETAVAVSVDELNYDEARNKQTNSLGELTFSYDDGEEKWGIVAIITLAMMIL